MHSMPGHAQLMLLGVVKPWQAVLSLRWQACWQQSAHNGLGNFGIQVVGLCLILPQDLALQLLLFLQQLQANSMGVRPTCLAAGTGSLSAALPSTPAG